MNKRALFVIGAIVALLALGGSAAFARMMAPAPSNLDLSTQLPTAQQHFIVSYTPSVTPPPINQLHTWTVWVTTPDGQPVEGATITVDGDMPQHASAIGIGAPARWRVPTWSPRRIAVGAAWAVEHGRYASP
jgi:hypothetical protein